MHIGVYLYQNCGPEIIKINKEIIKAVKNQNEKPIKKS